MKTGSYTLIKGVTKQRSQQDSGNVPETKNGTEHLGKTRGEEVSVCDEKTSSW